VLLAALSGGLVCAPWLYPQLYLSAWIGWEYFDRYSVCLNYARHASEWGVSLVFHDAEKAWIAGQQSNFNTLVHINEDGEQQGTYRKMQRMWYSRLTACGLCRKSAVDPHCLLEFENIAAPTYETLYNGQWTHPTA
jgi:hypothetical protein